jgi:hypothetical protein
MDRKLIPVLAGPVIGLVLAGVIVGFSLSSTATLFAILGVTAGAVALIAPRTILRSDEEHPVTHVVSLSASVPVERLEPLPDIPSWPEHEALEAALEQGKERVGRGEKTRTQGRSRRHGSVRTPG